MNEMEKATTVIKNLTQKVLELKAIVKSLEENQNSESSWYVKYQKCNSDKLALENKVAQLEMTVSLANFELEKRNKALMNKGV